MQTPHAHLSGNKCFYCACKKKRISNEEFIMRAKEIHGEEFEYLENYKTIRSKIRIKHIRCGNISYIRPGDHLAGCGCSFCSTSRGEKRIIDVLNKSGISFEIQKTFDDCRNPKTRKLLRFDFFLPDNDILIEYDGHFHDQQMWFDKNGTRLKYQIYLDSIKTNYVNKTNMKLIRIHYSDFSNIKNILFRELL